MLTCIVTWSAPTVSATTLLTTPSSSHFIVAGPAARKGSYTTFSVFSPVSQTPVRQIRIRHSFLHICLLASTPTSPNEIQFIGVSKDGEIYRFGDDVSAPSHRAKAVNNAQQKGTSIWQEMFGKDAFIEVEEIEEPTPVTAPSVRTHGKASEVYDGPSHTLPPVGLLFELFMEEILSDTAAKAEKMDVDEKIKYEKDAEVLSEALGANREAKCRVVSDDEMRDLEGFFKEVLTAGKSSLCIYPQS
jgi:NET1-associated nuclear protein 1 (U3 small nucleolar RNA-associated protein 17)